MQSMYTIGTTKQKENVMKILDIDVKDLDLTNCYLTYSGARRLCACTAALCLWGNKYDMKIMSTRQVVDRFWAYQVPLFITTAYRVIYDKTHPNIHRLCCYPDKTYTERHLKAIIIHACRQRDKGEIL